jgi:YggT family protein
MAGTFPRLPARDPLGNQDQRSQPEPRAQMRALLDVVFIALNAYWWIVIASAVFSWLVAFNVVNQRNDFVAMIGRFLYSVTEPVLRPIRRFLPNLEGIDISPVILLLAILLIQQIIIRYIYPNVF